MNQNERIQIEISLDERSLVDALAQIRSRIEGENFDITIAIRDQGVLDALNRIIDRLNDLNRATDNIAGVFETMNGSLNRTRDPLRASAENLDIFGVALGASAGNALDLGERVAGVNGLKAKLGILKVPIGLAVLALGGLWFAFRDTGDGANEAGEEVVAFSDRVAGYRDSYYDLQERLRNQATTFDAVSEAVSETNRVHDENDEVLNILGSNLEDLEGQMESYHQKWTDGVEYIERYGLTLGDLNEIQQEVVMALSDTFNGYVDTLRNGNLEITSSNRTGADEWQATMIRNQEIMTDWADNVDELCGRISEEMMDYIIALGPEYANRVQDMVNMSDDELAELEAVFLNNCQVAGRAALAGLDEAQIPAEVADLIFQSERTIQQAIRDADFQSIGLGVAEGLATGIGDGEHLVGTSASILARGCEDAMRLGLESNSPSRVFKRIGDDIVAGLAIGISDNQDQVTDVLETLGTAMGRVYNRTDRTFQNIGRDIINGLNQGLLNRENTVMNTVRRIANNITREMQRALQINSPSRVMREGIGRFIPEGVAAGIDKYAGAAVDSVHKLGNDLINVNIPSAESMIGMGPSMRYAGASGSGSTYHNNNSVNHHNQGLFDGAHIHWHNKEDIRQTMKEIAWTVYTEEGVL